MEWRSGRRSQNIEDRRGVGGGPSGMPGGFGRGGGGIRMGRAAGGGGIGIIVIALVMLFLGVDPSVILSGGAPMQQADLPASAPLDPAKETELGDFVAVVLADTEDTWTPIFRDRLNAVYEEPPLVLFQDGVQSACGFAQSATGPFYCPGDRKVYLDLAFFDELDQRFGAPGDFAQAYVVAHEVGHHVQNLLGILPKVHQYRQQVDAARANDASVRLELQADCFAGVWAHNANRARRILEEGDVEEGLNAASQIGDDRMQRRAGGYVSPESFTHGSSEQRVRWFRTGLETGDLQACDTFNAQRL